MEAFIERSLVVDASFTSRRQLVHDLRTAEVSREIIEAPSVREGIVTLESSPLNACFVGPTLTEVVAVDFVRRGIEISNRRDCAFLAVLREGRSPLPFINAGAHATLTLPCPPRKFSAIVKQAVTAAATRAARENADEQHVPVTASSRRMSLVLSELADALDEIGRDISRGRFSLRPNGQPSLATRDAIRLAIETAITAPGEFVEIGSFDHYFISKVVEWFLERINTDQNTSIKRLRTKLVSYRPPAEVRPEGMRRDSP